MNLRPLVILYVVGGGVCKKSRARVAYRPCLTLRGEDRGGGGYGRSMWDIELWGLELEI